MKNPMASLRSWLVSKHLIPAHVHENGEWQEQIRYSDQVQRRAERLFEDHRRQDIMLRRRGTTR